jgi:hypothetical protein
VFSVALVLAFFVEMLLEYIFGIWWKPLSDEKRPKVLMAFGLLLGIVICLYYKTDLVAAAINLLPEDLLPDGEIAPSTIGYILTGAAIGRGSEWLHQFYNRIKPIPPAATPS